MESSSGNRAATKTAQPMDESDPERLSDSSTPMDLPHSKDKLSSLLEVKSSSKRSRLIPLPGDPLFFNPCVDLKKLKRSSDLMIKEKMLLISGREKMQHPNHDVVGLTGDRPSDKQQSKEQPPVPCSMKKRKALLLEHDKSSDVNASDAQRSGPRDRLFTDNGAAEADAKFPSHKNKDVHLYSQQFGAAETKGYAFLIQVKEKLSPAEYKDFVGYMKEWKSEVLKIGDFLQCIVGLFSGPERLPLLLRFKDFVPARYLPLYEQYLESKEMPDKQRN